MTKRNVIIRIDVSRIEAEGSLFDDGLYPDEEDEEELAGDPGLPETDAPEEEPEDAEVPEEDGEEPLWDFPEPDELMMEGRFLTGSERVELVYEEPNGSGMEGTVTTVGFSRQEPGIVTMMRTGMVGTALVFEEGKRHICVYHTPFSDFEVCVRTKRLENRLLTDRSLTLDYLIEIHGAQAERCRMTLTFRDADEDGTASMLENLMKK